LGSVLSEKVNAAEAACHYNTVLIIKLQSFHNPWSGQDYI
jgi:hypothetical protein